MRPLNDLALLLMTDPLTYARHVTQVATMDAQAEATKLVVRAVTREYEQKLRKQDTRTF